MRRILIKKLTIFPALLCQQGADPHVEDETGKTVFDIAKEKNLTKIEELLSQYKK